ncbi:hypothetical protein FO519_003136 [Halicephalobus sp. NKZ332]|nr:hypothetical protein FO519_003136 [Halicephalobus sp. NKZ332]
MSFYDTYKDYSIITPAIPVVSLLMVIDTIGIIANFLVIIITVHSKKLRSTTNFLLAMQCFSDSLHVLAHYYLAYAIYSGKNFDTLHTCFRVMIGPLIGLNFGMGLVFFIAVDRLVILLFPIKHQQLNKLLYLGSIVTICTACNVCILYIGYLNAEEHKDNMVICLISNGLYETPIIIWSIMTASFVFGSFSIYIIIRICIHHKVDSNSSTKKLYKPLFITCILMTSSWILISTSLVLCAVFQLSEELSLLIPLHVGITINIACGSNFFVLTRYSKEYRSATRELFEKIGNTKISKPIVVNVSSNMKSP